MFLLSLLSQPAILPQQATRKKSILTCNRLFLFVRFRSGFQRQKKFFSRSIWHIIFFISTTVKMQPIFIFSTFLILWRYCGWIPFVFSQYPKDWQFFCINTGDSCIHALSNFCSDYCKPFPFLYFILCCMTAQSDSPGCCETILFLLFKSFCVTPLDYLIMLFPVFHIFSYYPKGPLQFPFLSQLLMLLPFLLCKPYISPHFAI